jgi:hypothetical protein
MLGGFGGRSTAMPDYRIYTVNKDDHFIGVEDVSLQSDTAALAHARTR